jgi:hypothetical protein
MIAERLLFWGFILITPAVQAWLLIHNVLASVHNVSAVSSFECAWPSNLSVWHSSTLHTFLFD